MSIIEYNNTRRCLPQSLTFPNYYYNERNAPLELSHGTRTNPRGYPIGGLYGRANMGREEPPTETGPARRRIAVACARCRKRKIRCSGDPGNGGGCTNCKQAGIDPAACQFHRVGSDNVHKVMDNLNIAHSLTSLATGNRMVPLYSANTSLYSRPISAHQYPPLDTKPVYPPTWTVPYSEDTSPIDTYNLDQPGTYLTNTTPLNNTNMYAQPCRWTHPVTKPLHQETGAYVDQGSPYPTNGLPYIQTNLRSTATEPLSPLNMSSLQLSLPERPRARPLHASEGTAPQRQLPIPQPNPAQTSRNVVDQLQDQRLRSAQANNASAMSTGASFAKPLLPWSPADGDNQINASEATPPTGTLSITSETAIGYLPTTSIADEVITASAPPQINFNFSTSNLLEAMNAPAPTSTYSNFRDFRTPQPKASQMERHNSQNNVYSFNSDHTLKRHSLGGETSNDYMLVGGHRYTPLGRSQPLISTFADSLHEESLDDRNIPLHRASMSNLHGSF
ncbi:Nn.00g072710.m01.CDS01 [Neocucurbitaria sp. VM-36]